MIALQRVAAARENSLSLVVALSLSGSMPSAAISAMNSVTHGFTSIDPANAARRLALRAEESPARPSRVLWSCASACARAFGFRRSHGVTTLAMRSQKRRRLPAQRPRRTKGVTTSVIARRMIMMVIQTTVSLPRRRHGRGERSGSRRRFEARAALCAIRPTRSLRPTAKQMTAIRRLADRPATIRPVQIDQQPGRSLDRRRCNGRRGFAALGERPRQDRRAILRFELAASASATAAETVGRPSAGRAGSFPRLPTWSPRQARAQFLTAAGRRTRAARWRRADRRGSGRHTDGRDAGVPPGAAFSLVDDVLERGRSRWP